MLSLLWLLSMTTAVAMARLVCIVGVQFEVKFLGH
jgi:hypothetical protein